MPHEFKTDLFMYPSIQSSMKDINFAINPNTVDECLMLKYLLILQVTDLDLENNLIRVDTTHYGISDGSKIDIRLSGTFSHGLDPVYLEILEEFNRIEE